MVMESKDQTGDFFPHDLMLRMMRWWWVIVIFAVAGGVAGFILSRLQKPLYESDAVITTTIDYAYAGRLNDYMVDHLISAIGDVIDSSHVIEKVVDETRSAGIELNDASIKEGLTISRQGYRWVLSSQFHDPGLAMQINQIWLSAAMDALEGLKQNSLKGLDQLAYQHALESCFSQAVVLEPASSYCNAEDLEQLRLDVNKNLQNETNQSMLVSLQISKISFEVVQTPSEPNGPVRNNTNLVTVAGSAAGLILALILFLSGFPKPRQQGK